MGLILSLGYGGVFSTVVIRSYIGLELKYGGLTLEDLREHLNMQGFPNTHSRLRETF